MQDVIFREVYNKYTKTWGFMAIFPDLPANRGRVSLVEFEYQNDKPIFYSYDEGDIDIVLSKKIVHKNDERIERLKTDVEKYIGDDVNVVERMTEKHRQFRTIDY